MDADLISRLKKHTAALSFIKYDYILLEQLHHLDFIIIKFFQLFMLPYKGGRRKTL